MSKPAHVFEVSIPGYRIVRRLGDGGMATVYLAVQTGLDRTVALKVLKLQPDQDPDATARFENEARTIARLDHPHIVRIFDVGRSEAGQLYFTMQFLPGGDLSHQDDRRQPARIIEIMRALLQALEYAHNEGVVHRDVKPENVLFDANDQPKLADFGIALNRTAQMRVTQAGMAVGSSGYMSPEQARGMSTDGRSDLYSLGIVLYELLTREMPFHGPDALSVAIAQVEDPIPQLPPAQSAWQPLLDGCLAKDPDQRFDHARHMLAALERAVPAILSGQARPGFWARILPRRSQRNRGILVGASAAVVAAVLLLTMSLLRFPGFDREPATPTSATPSAPPATPEAPILGSAELDQMLREANARLVLGALVLPAYDNAGDRFATILETYPGQAEAVSGMASLLDQLAQDIAEKLQRGDAEAAMGLYAKAQQLANRAGVRQLPSWSPFVDRVRNIVATSLDDASRNAPGRLSRLAPLADVFGLPLPKPQTRPADSAKQDATTRRTRSKPGFATVKLDGGSLAVAHHEVTRAEYARFVRATGHQTGDCRVPRNPFSRLRNLSWKDAGYPQSGDHPVVCVSWQDATAYAAWISKTSGASYRLATPEEWMELANKAPAPADCKERAACNNGTRPVSHETAAANGVAGLDGNVGTWLACEGDCSEVRWAGRSFRDDRELPAKAFLDQTRSDTGYTTIGIRLVQDRGKEP